MRNKNKRRREYTAFFEPRERGGYTVTVPSLPGLVTQGKNLDYARAMGKDTIRCYIEGLRKANKPIPVTRESAGLRICVVVSSKPQDPTLARGARMGHLQRQRPGRPRGNPIHGFSTPPPNFRRTDA